MRILSEVNIKLKGELSETKKIIQSFNMHLPEVVQSERRKTVLFENFRYTINKTTPISIYLKCFRKCGVRMVANGSLTEIRKQLGQHNHKEEVELVKKEKMGRKFISAVKRYPTKVLKDVQESVLESSSANPCPEGFPVKPTLYREKSTQVPQVPTSAGILMITGRWANTLTDSRILLKNDRNSGIVVFATEHFLKLITETSNITNVGTFKACPYPFEQPCFFSELLMKEKFH